MSSLPPNSPFVVGPTRDDLRNTRPLLWFSEWGDGVFVGSLPDSTQRRLDSMVDPEMYRHEPLYHGMVSQFRLWLVGAEMAMRDEEVDNEVIECVLNRMVYGHPSGAEAHERRDLMRQQREMMEKGPTPPLVISDLPGLVHGPHMADRPYTHEEGLPRPWQPPMPGKGKS